MPVQQGRPIIIPMMSHGIAQTDYPPFTASPQELSEILRRRVSFTEISNMAHSALIVFPKNEDKK